MNSSRLFLALVLLSFACQTKTGQENQVTSTTATASEDTVAALAKRPAPDGPRSAADRLVRALYFEHQKEENPFRETKNRSVVDQFFAKPLADQIWNSKKPVKANLLFNAPDAAVTKKWVEPAALGGSRAAVYVTFQNKTKPEEIRIDLQQFAGRWRITDMLYPGGKQLTQLL